MEEEGGGSRENVTNFPQASVAGIAGNTQSVLTQPMFTLSQSPHFILGEYRRDSSNYPLAKFIPSI